MSKTLEQKAKDFSHTNGNQSCKSMREVEYDTGRYVGYLAGFKDCQKEYEEKLRWIPVEEKLPEINDKESDGLSEVVSIRSVDYFATISAIYDHNDKEWLSYPGNHVVINVVEWRTLFL